MIFFPTEKLNISCRKCEILLTQYASLPYSKIQAFSVETAGVFDLDSELELWFSGLGRVKFEFVKNANVSAICKMISERVL